MVARKVKRTLTGCNSVKKTPWESELRDLELLEAEKTHHQIYQEIILRWVGRSV